MPSIATVSKPVTEFPNKFISPFSDEPQTPLYSSIPISLQNSDCLPCVICGNIYVRNKVIQEQASKFSGYAPNIFNADTVFVGIDN